MFCHALTLPAWRRRAVAAALAGAAGAVGAEPWAFVTNQGSHDVSVIDLASQRTVATLPVGRSPAGVVAVAAQARVFVSNPDSGDLSVIDLHPPRVVATWPAGLAPLGLDASADGRRLYAVDWHGRALLAWTLPAQAEATSATSATSTTSATPTEPGATNTPTPAASPLPPPSRTALGQAPAGVAAVDARHAWVAERDDNRVALVDADAQRVLARVAVGEHPFALLLDAPRQRLLALNVLSHTVSVVDTVQRRVVATLKVGRSPYGAAIATLADGRRRLFITNQHDDSVSVFDADSLQPLALLQGFGYPEGIAAHRDRVYVVNWMDEQLSVLDAASGQRLADLPTGRNPRGFGAFIASAATATHAPTATPPATAPAATLATSPTHPLP